MASAYQDYQDYQDYDTVDSPEILDSVKRRFVSGNSEASSTGLEDPIQGDEKGGKVHRFKKSFLDPNTPLEDQKYDLDEMKKYFERLSDHNYERKLERLSRYKNARSEVEGFTFHHLVLQLPCLTSSPELICGILDCLPYNCVTDRFGKYPIHYAIDLDCEEIVTWFLEQDETVLDLGFNGERDFNLMHYAASRGSYNSICIIHTHDPSMINRKLEDKNRIMDIGGFFPLNSCLLLSKNSFGVGDEKRDQSLKFLIENTDSESYFIGLGGTTVLHILIVANYLEGIRTLLQKLKIEGRDSLDGMKINGYDELLNIEHPKVPLIYALEQRFECCLHST